MNKFIDSKIEEFNSICLKYTAEEFVKEYGGDISFLPCQSIPEFKMLLDFMIYIKPKKILLIGVDKGADLYYFSKIFPESLIVCVDIDFSKLKKENYNNVVFILGDSTSKETINAVKEQSERYDFVFIDGCHYGHYPSSDFNNYSLVNNGIVAMHDYAQPGDEIRSVCSNIKDKTVVIFVEPGKMFGTAMIIFGEKNE